MEVRCHREIVELHQFFQDWLGGHVQPTADNFARLVAVLSEDFIIIDPHGKLIEGKPLRDMLRAGHGSRQDFKIWIQLLPKMSDPAM